MTARMARDYGGSIRRKLRRPVTLAVRARSLPEPITLDIMFTVQQMTS